MAEHTITGFQDFIENIQEKLGNNRPEYEYYFRGHPDHGYAEKLIPGIYRNGNIINENILFKETIIRSPNEFLNEKTALEKLVKMRHYELPTRLLDITSNPLVALFFACENEKYLSKNGEVVVFKIPQEKIKYYDSDTVSLISNLAKLDVKMTFEQKEQEYNSLIWEIQEEKAYFYDSLYESIKKDIVNVIPVKVKLNNNRILKQSGAFLIFGIKEAINKNKPAPLPDWITKSLIIPPNLKSTLLDVLSSLGINRSTLFPELENQSKYLKDKYYKKN